MTFDRKTYFDGDWGGGGEGGSMVEHGPIWFRSLGSSVGITIDWESYFDDEWRTKQLSMVQVNIYKEDPQSWLHRLMILFWHLVRDMWLRMVMVDINEEITQSQIQSWLHGLRIKSLITTLYRVLNIHAYCWNTHKDRFPKGNMLIVQCIAYDVTATSAILSSFIMLIVQCLAYDVTTTSAILSSFIMLIVWLQWLVTSSNITAWWTIIENTNWEDIHNFMQTIS